MKALVAMLFLIPVNALAATLTNIQILEVLTDAPDEFQFKVRGNETAPDSYFILSFAKDSKDNLDKLNYMLLKQAKPSRYQLDIVVPGFSPYPPGSIYNVTDVRFFQKGRRIPNSAPDKKSPLKKRRN